jgi:hypothetical protein
MALKILAVRFIPADRPPHPGLLPARGEKERGCVAGTIFCVVIASVSEAIQFCRAEAGLLRRSAPRNDEVASGPANPFAGQDKDGRILHHELMERKWFRLPVTARARRGRIAARRANRGAKSVRRIWSRRPARAQTRPRREAGSFARPRRALSSASAAKSAPFGEHQHLSLTKHPLRPSCGAAPP